MKRFQVVAGVMMMGLLVQAAEGKHIARAVLQSRTGAPVASVQADSNGFVRFTNVPPGEYQIVLTSADGRSVTLADLDGDGHLDISIEGTQVGGITGGAVAGKVNVQDLSLTKSPAPGAPSTASPGSGGGAGKVSVQDLSMTKRQPQGAAMGGALPGGAVISGGAAAPRDQASGLPTGRRMHKPMVCLVDWDLAKGKGGYASERVAQAEGQQLPDNINGRCVVKVVADQQPGTIEVQSWSWGMSQTGKQNKTGHVTLMK